LFAESACRRLNRRSRASRRSTLRRAGSPACTGACRRAGPGITVRRGRGRRVIMGCSQLRRTQPLLQRVSVSSMFYSIRCSFLVLCALALPLSGPWKRLAGLQRHCIVKRAALGRVVSQRLADTWRKDHAAHLLPRAPRPQGRRVCLENALPGRALPAERRRRSQQPPRRRHRLPSLALARHGCVQRQSTTRPACSAPSSARLPDTKVDSWDRRRSWPRRYGHRLGLGRVARRGRARGASARERRYELLALARRVVKGHPVCRAQRQPVARLGPPARARPSYAAP
jgi:hypothetical protein